MIHMCVCGLTKSFNPHPDAGKPTIAGTLVGYQYECIPCLVRARNASGARLRTAERQVQSLENRLEDCAVRSIVARNPGINEVDVRARVHADLAGARKEYEPEEWKTACREAASLARRLRP